MQTIFATATAPIKSGVAIIRISGAKAGLCIEKLTGQGAIKPRQARLLRLRHPQSHELVDEALTLWFPAPASFTGEDVAEFHVHGSRAVISEILEILSKIEGLRLAEPGEFSRRAFENGKMDLTEAEGLADLIDAETKIQARQALRQKQGGLKDIYDNWRTQLVAIMANIEAYIDFPDEEIPQDIIKKVEKSVTSLQNAIAGHLNDNMRGEKLRSGLHAVIIGAPNVGKSSLLNAIAKRDAAIVSNIAGTTRDIVEVHLDLGGYPVTLADTAGLRSHARTIEKEGIKRALMRAEDADVKIAMFDAAKLPEIDKQTLKLLDENTIVIINKTDKVKKLKIPAALAKFAPLSISAGSGDGVGGLTAKLQQFAKDYFDITSDPVITRARHRQLLTETAECLSRFTLREAPELASENLRRAALSLGRITGHIDVEEILDNIFSSFCIGK